VFLDTHLQSPEERLEFVNKWLEQNPEPNELEMEWIANYLVYPIDKEERRQRKILTDNRQVTINAHEASYEGLSSKFEAGDDALEAISLSRTPITTNITPRKRAITQRELDAHPELAVIRDSAVEWQKISKTLTGRKAF
jgi:hypothetical protein